MPVVFFKEIMYKNLFVRAWEILFSPSKTWDKIARESEDDKKYLTNFFYPFLGLVAFTAFLNPFISGNEDLDFMSTLSIGMQYFIMSFASGFFGFFIAAKALNYCFIRWFGIPADTRKAEKLTAYSLTPVLVVSIMTRLLSDFFFMKILFVYIVILVWEASAHFYSVEEKTRGKFTLLSCITILAVPFIVEKIFIFLLPGLK